MKKIIILILFCGFVFQSCEGDVVPKPTSQLKLQYPEPSYEFNDTNYPFGLDVNSFSKLINKENGAVEIHYPKMRATVYLSYKQVDNDIEKLLIDAQKLTYKLHVMKADEIEEQPFVNPNKKLYGMFYSVGGNSASNALFYATDSTKNFVTASVYFYAKPNFDSILPAANYVTNDMRIMLESIKWKK